MVKNVTRRVAVVVLVTVLGATSAACSKSKKSSQPGGSSGDTTTTTIPADFPLTGLPAVGPDGAKAGRPALVLKIENHPRARPQSGLDVADIVYEEVVEGGQTRYLAVFHSADSDPAGPVRSVRPSDPDILAPYKPLFGYSGGTPKFISLVRATPGLTDVGVDNVPDAYIRRPGRAAPHNQYTSTTKLYEKAPSGAAPPPEFAEFLDPGQPFAAGGAAPVATLALSVGSSTKVAYTWDAAGGVFKRSLDGTPHTVEGGGQLAPTNVIVQFTPYAVSPGDSDVTGAPVLKANVVGSGEAWIFSGGMLVKGKWAKSSATAMTTFTDATGNPVKLVPGRTWVELPAPGVPATTT